VTFGLSTEAESPPVSLQRSLSVVADFYPYEALAGRRAWEVAEAAPHHSTGAAKFVGTGESNKCFGDITTFPTEINSFDLLFRWRIVVRFSLLTRAGAPAAHFAERVHLTNYQNLHLSLQKRLFFD
jgi:hypothetical protein